MTELLVSLLDGPLTRSLLSTTHWNGLRVEVRTAATVDANTRAMLRGEFHVAEMSFATYLHARAWTDAPLWALPAFTGRRLLQSHAAVRPGAGIRGVADLGGRRVAVPQYWMTSSVWHRILLRDHYGIDPATLTWITTAPERFKLIPPGVRVWHCSDGRTPAQLVADGDADVLLSPRPRPAGLDPLFADERAEEQRCYAATAVFPIMHLVVVRADLTAATADRVWECLVAARSAAGADEMWSYGVSPNAPTLTALLAGAHREGLLPAPLPTTELFFPVARKAVR